jgi:hypothetical protein
VRHESLGQRHLEDRTLSTTWHFPIFIVAALFAFIGVLRASLGRRSVMPSRATFLWVASIVVVGGMSFAKVGATSGLPVWLYYGVPAALTWAFPPLAFRMTWQEVLRYVPLAVLVAPAIHVVFALVLGWKEYMPFIPVPSLAELLDSVRTRAG